MTSSILLLSADQTLEQVIRLALSRGVSLQTVNLTATYPLPEKVHLTARPALVLMDTDEMADPASRLPEFARDGIPTVAIISDLNKREALFRAGIDDYLSKPLILEEIKARLSPYLPELDIEDSQKFQREQTFERESQEHLARQLIQNERWITIGRSIASICHDLTNRVQATQGALSLALEEPALSNSMQAYLSISQQETRRIGMQVERLRHIYHPETDRMAKLDIAELLEETITLASDAMSAQGVTIEVSLTADMPVIRGRIGQLQFVLLGLLLNLIDLISSKNGGVIRAEAGMIGPTVQIGFSTDAPLSVISNQHNAAKPGPPARIIEYALGLPTLKQTILAQNGDAGLVLNDPGLSVWISLPIA